MNDFTLLQTATSGVTSVNGQTGAVTVVTDKIEEGNTLVEAVDGGGDGYIKINTEGTERVRVKSNGDVLIGRTSTSTGYPLCVQAHSTAEGIVVIGRAADDIGEIGFFENDTTTRLGEIQYRQDHVNFRHRVGDIRFASGGSG